MVKQQDSPPPAPPPSSESGSLASPVTDFPFQKASSLLHAFAYSYALPSAAHDFEAPGPFSYKETSLASSAYRSLPSPAPVSISPLLSPPQELTPPSSVSAPCPCGSPPTPNIGTSPVHSPSNSARPIACPPRSFYPLPGAPPPAPRNHPPIASPATAEPGPWRGIPPTSWTSPPPTAAPSRSASPLSPRDPPIYSTPNKLPQPWKLSPPLGGRGVDVLSPARSPAPGAPGFVQPFDVRAKEIHRHYEAIVGVTIGAFFLGAIALLLLAMFFIKKRKYPRCLTDPNVVDEAGTDHGLKRSESSLSPTTPRGGGISSGMLPSTEDGNITRNDVSGAKAGTASSAGPFSAGKRKTDNNGNGIAEREAIHSGGLYGIRGREDSRGPGRSRLVDQHRGPKMEGPAEVKFKCCLDGQEAESLVVVGCSQRNGLDNAERPLGSGDRCNRQGKSVRTRNFGNGAPLK